MRTIPILLSLFLLSACATSGGPGRAPAMSIGVDLGRDARQWTIDSTTHSGSSFTAYVIPKGQTMAKCDGMVTEMVILTADSSASLAATWKAQLAVDNAGEPVTESLAADGSPMLEYRLAKDDTFAVQKFMKGPDGVYIVIFNTRNATLDDPARALWRDIVATATLVPAPH